MWKKNFINLLFPANPHEMDINKAMDLKDVNIPTSLFKYRSFDEKGYSIKILEEDEIWLSTPEKFNDPYDCALNYAANDLGNEFFQQDIYRFLERLSSEYKFSEDEIEYLKSSKRFMYDFTKIFAKKHAKADEMTPEQYAEVISKVVEQEFEDMATKLSTALKSGLFITCFSETNKSILMWSHYAANHTGFCIEYDFSKLSIKDPRKRLLYPVIYDDNMFDATEYLRPTFENKEFNNLMISYAAMNKSEEWRYEREWRYILPYGPTKEVLTLKVPKPIAVYLGAKISDENKIKILDIGKRKGFQIFQMAMENSRFNLNMFKLQ